MLNKYILESIKSSKELEKLYLENKQNYIEIIDRLLEMGEYEAVLSILEDKLKESSFTINEVLRIAKSLQLVAQEAADCDYLENILHFLLKINFACDYENFLILKIVADLVVHQKTFKVKSNAVLFFKRLLSLSTDLFLIFNIIHILNILGEKVVSAEEYEFIRRCAEITAISDSDKINRLKFYNGLLCGFKTKKITDFVPFQSFLEKSKITEKLPFFDEWKKLITDNFLPATEKSAVFLKFYNFDFDQNNGCFLIKSFNYKSISRRIYEITRKFQKPKEMKLVAEIYSKKEEKKLIPDKEEKKLITEKEEKRFQKKFNKNYARFEAVYGHFQFRKEDSAFEERRNNYNREVEIKREMLREKQVFYVENREIISAMISKLNKKIMEKEEERIKKIEEQRKLEREAIEKEKEERSWANRIKNINTEWVLKPSKPIYGENKNDNIYRPDESVNEKARAKYEQNKRLIKNDNIYRPDESVNEKARAKYEQMKAAEKSQKNPFVGQKTNWEEKYKFTPFNKEERNRNPFIGQRTEKDKEKFYSYNKEDNLKNPFIGQKTEKDKEKFYSYNKDEKQSKKQQNPFANYRNIK
ncbi:hypothetical protein NUSPORA_01636 [Nucleospora cyclopteri]